jgi:hypothetical protein
MGGRGTYASGNNVAYVYKTVDKIDGIKVLEPLDPKKSFSMPAEAHTSMSYIVLDKLGTFRQYREYNEQHLPTFEIGYHFEKGISTHGESVLHYHEYSAPGVEYRGKAKPITQELIEKYKKYFKGIKNI